MRGHGEGGRETSGSAMGVPGDGEAFRGEDSVHAPSSRARLPAPLPWIWTRPCLPNIDRQVTANP